MGGAFQANVNLGRPNGFKLVQRKFALDSSKVPVLPSRSAVRTPTERLSCSQAMSALAVTRVTFALTAPLLQAGRTPEAACLLQGQLT